MARSAWRACCAWAVSCARELCPAVHLRDACPLRGCVESYAAATTGRLWRPMYLTNLLRAGTRSGTAWKRKRSKTRQERIHTRTATDAQLEFPSSDAEMQGRGRGAYRKSLPSWCRFSSKRRKQNESSILLPQTPPQIQPPPHFDFSPSLSGLTSRSSEGGQARAAQIKPKS
eukprot:1107304-Rhodomonas_salina.1